jgi:hypothetical protein
MTFDEDLEFSKSKEGALDRIYKSYFKTVGSVEKINRIGEMTRQRSGVDTELTLESGEKIVIQEKYRRRNYADDFLIEFCSVCRSSKCKRDHCSTCQGRGWIYTIDADYIFCVYLNDVIKIYPVVQLKLAWYANHAEWMKNYTHMATTSNGWTKYGTLFSTVPVAELEREILRATHFEYQQQL